MPLTNRIAVITGATGQLGPAISRVLATNGAKLALCAPNGDELTALALNLGFPDSRVLTSPRDLMDEASAQALADEVIAYYGHVDILIHLVGGYQSSPLLSLPTETWEYMLNLNLRTAMNAMRALLPYLTANGWGRIITLSSALADRPSANSAAYSAAKAGLEALTLAVGQEVRDKGVTANVLLVKTIETSQDRAAAPAGRPTAGVTPEEVASLVLYLCSDDAGSISGTRIPLFGRG
jgi:NAD(P)-dependent dehydrogenase (short-subunit alcohol dehydrogenase family)